MSRMDGRQLERLSDRMERLNDKMENRFMWTIALLAMATSLTHKLCLILSKH